MPRKILIVDDSPTQAALLTHTLREHIVDIAMDGKSGLERALNSNYDLIILDLNLPDMSGLEVCKLYNETKKDAYVLIVSSEDQLAHIKFAPNGDKVLYSVKDGPIVANRVELIFLKMRRQQHLAQHQPKEALWQS